MFDWMINNLDTVLVIVRGLELLAILYLVKLTIEIWRDK